MFFTVSGSGGSASASNQADLVIEYVRPRQVDAVGKVYIEIAVGNKGGVDVSRPVEVVVTIGGDQRRARTTAGIPAGRTAFASIEMQSDVFNRNPHGTVQVDPSNEVRESDKTNNSRSF